MMGLDMASGTVCDVQAPLMTFSAVHRYQIEMRTSPSYNYEAAYNKVAAQSFWAIPVHS